MRSRIVISIAAAGGVVVAGAGLAAAQTPADDGVISACYVRSGGSLRVLDADAWTCGRNKTLLTWNQSGASGADGVSGFLRVAESVPYPADTIASRLVSCPAGTVALGGGASVYWPDVGLQVTSSDFALIGSAPYEGDNAGDGWRLTYRTTSATAVPGLEIHFYANCAVVAE